MHKLKRDHNIKMILTMRNVDNGIILEAYNDPCASLENMDAHGLLNKQESKDLKETDVSDDEEDKERVQKRSH